MSEDTKPGIEEEITASVPAAIKELPLSKMRCPFSVALKFLKDGYRVARAGWNGKGMYLWLLPHASVPTEWIKDPILKRIADENGGVAECLPSIRMRTADGSVLTGWLASQTDLIAEDWLIVLDEEVMVQIAEVQST